MAMRAQGKSSWARKGATALLATLGAALLAIVAAALTPIAADRLALSQSSSLRIEARDGTLLRELVARDGDGHAAPAHLDELPPHVWQAFVAAEDGRFFSHPGVDPLALARAAGVDLKRRRLAQGGSGIAQQLARMIEPRPRSLPGKAAEALFALRLMRTLGHREVLEQYLSRVPLGNDVRGVEAASRLYFDRPARTLTPRQAALLAAIPRGPSAFDPLRHQARAEAAAGRILTAMAARGFLTAAQLEGAREAPLDLAASKFEAAFEAPHFVEHVARAQAPKSAVTVRTTLDLSLQRKLEQAAREEIAALADKRASSAAVIILDNQSGEVLAYVGSPDWFDEDAQGRIDGVRTHRQPGSSLKPFAYGAAIDRGLITAATLLPDVESHFSTPGGDYVPKNYDRRAHGPVRARVALASSYNVPAVRVAERLGASELLSVMRAAGLGSLTLDAEHYGLGLVLGDGEVTLEELARAYAGLARGGVQLPKLTYLKAALGADGSALPLESPKPGRRFIGKPAAALIADMLSDPGARAPSFGLENALRFPFPVAAKTGTSRAFTDNWTAGFTHERTVAVWVGNMSGATMHHVSGITGAGPLFQRAMLLAMESVDTPVGLGEGAALEEHAICALSGELAGPHCPSTALEKFVPGSAPKTPCSMHGEDGLDLGPHYYDWAEHEGVHTLAKAQTGGAKAALAFPAEGDQFLRDRDLPDEDQTIPVRALAPRGGGPLELQLDDGPRVALGSPYSTRVPASHGAHRLRLFRGGAGSPDAQVAFRVDG
jgi:penicillin-binding protein 1C